METPADEASQAGGESVLSTVTMFCAGAFWPATVDQTDVLYRDGFEN